MNALTFDPTSSLEWRSAWHAVRETLGAALSIFSFAAGLWVMLVFPGLLG